MRIILILLTTVLASMLIYYAFGPTVVGAYQWCADTDRMVRAKPSPHSAFVNSVPWDKQGNVERAITVDRLNNE
jgi:hypothetical protein